MTNILTYDDHMKIIAESESEFQMLEACEKAILSKLKEGIEPAGIYCGSNRKLGDVFRADIPLKSGDLLYLIPDQQVSILKDRIKALEEFRPHWAKGYTSDSVAAQVYCASLSVLWEALGVENQTDAVRQIKELEAARTAFNSAINFAIDHGLGADVFLTAWREGDWDTCRDFGYNGEEMK